MCACLDWTGLDGLVQGLWEKISSGADRVTMAAPRRNLAERAAERKKEKTEDDEAEKEALAPP